MKTKSKKVFVFSDTHLMCRTSIFYCPPNANKAEQRYRKDLFRKLMNEMQKADIIVMNGDIFELLYSTYLLKPGIEQNEAKEKATDAALATLRFWLENELKGKEVYFPKGNHEKHDRFWSGLKQLEKEFNGTEGKAMFMPKKHLKKIGNVAFIHGDKDTNSGIFAWLDKAEEKLARNTTSSKAMEELNLSWEEFVQGIRNENHNPERICRHIADSLESNSKLWEKHPGLLSKIDHIIFSHVHIPMFGHKIKVKVKDKNGDLVEKEITFHNTGSATNHGKDNFMTFDIEIKENGKHGNISNIVYLSLFHDARKAVMAVAA